MELKDMKIIFGFLLFVQVLGECDCEVPSIIGLPSYVTASENISIGSVLFTFNATVAVLDEEIVIHTNGPDTANIVFVNQTRGNDIFVQVITKTELDRDGYGIPGKSRVELEFQAVDLRANMISIRTVLYLTDVNDNAPQLQNLPYHWSISEHFHFGNESYDKVSANDFDAGINGMLRYRIEPITKSESLATEYRATFTMDTVTGVIKLERNLDYEKHNIYHFNITATDENGNGRTSEHAVLTIRVLDVQDTPPIFTSGSYTALLHNNFEVNSLVITVNALDGDTGYSPLNDVDYSILQGPCSELFSINKQGDIRTTKPIGDNTQAFEPSCVLTVSAQEVDVDPSKQYGSTKTKTTVRMVLESKDINHESCSSGTRFNAIMSIYFAVAAVSLMLKTS